ncbi:MAG: UDP-N-acetylmuramoyl-tripeptide--D-alanyl-D-alanine ligase [Succinivibrio sp.]
MISFRLSALAMLGNYTLLGPDVQISRVSTDSRNCEGALFVAIKGERFDGHDYIEKAIEAGAQAVVSSRVLPDNIISRVSVVLCDDTVQALGYCGLIVRRQSKAKVASLTGSCGKTTVKEFTFSILSQCGNTLCTQGNFNNDIGVPLTLLNLTQEHEYAVIEQGGSHLFDISHTCEFVKADTALINNVGGAHLEGFGSYDGIYRGKSQIIDSVLSRSGKAAVPSDSQYFERWQSEYKSAFKDGSLISFGSHDYDFVQYRNVRQSTKGICFDIRTPDSEFSVSLNVLGAHNAQNAAAACALALITGADTDALRTGLNRASSIQGRLFAHEYRNMTVIDDAYNASFNACISAADTLSLYQGHRVYVFGDMGELGDEAVALHEKLGEHVKDRVDEILTVGKLSENTSRCAGVIGRHFNCHSDLVQYARDLIKRYPYVTFLVKGSHAMHMDTVSKELMALGEQQ